MFVVILISQIFSITHVTLVLFSVAIGRTFLMVQDDRLVVKVSLIALLL
jgi:hypothetical protein